MNETFRYPIKVLLDEDRNVFIPFITSNAVLVSGTNENVAQQIANRYTKAEVDNLIAGLGTLQRLVGRVDTYADLPATGNQNGDTWLVGLTSASNHSEYMYVNGSWEELGPLVDLSVFYTKDQIDAMNVTISNNITQCLQAAKDYTDSKTGTLSNLETTVKNNLVAAINEVFGMYSTYNASIAARLQQLATVDEDAIDAHLASLSGGGA